MTHTLSLNISTPLNHLFHTSNVKIYIFRHDQHLLRPTRDNCYKAGRIEGRKCQRLEVFPNPPYTHTHTHTHQY